MTQPSLSPPAPTHDGAPLEASPSRLRASALFVWSLVAAFFALNLLSVLNHAMWRDEWHVWEMGRFTNTLSEMFEQVLSNGRPLGWYVLAWFICKAGFYPLGLKFFHVLVSTLGILLLARFAPLTRLQKVMLAFSYYPFYEYGTILRDYAFETLAAFTVCAVLTSRKRRPIAFGLAVFFLTQTTAQGVMIAGVFGAIYLFDLWWRPPTDPRQGWNARLALGVLIAFVGVGLAYAAMRPTPGKDYTVFGIFPRTDSMLYWAIDSIRYIFRGYVPVPPRGGWGGNFLDPMPIVQAAAGLALVFIVARWMLLTVVGRAFYLLGTGVLAGLFFYLPQLGATRYHGQYFVVLILALWIDRAQAAAIDEAAAPGREAPPAPRRRRVANALVVAALAIHLLAAGIAVAVERMIPFSGARQAAAIIRSNAPPDVPIIGDCDYAVASVAGELDRPIYIACRRDYSTFVKCDNKRLQVPMDPNDLKRVVDEFRAQQKRDVVLVVSYPLKIEGPGVWFLGATPAITDERFMIYMLRHGY